MNIRDLKQGSYKVVSPTNNSLTSSSSNSSSGFPPKAPASVDSGFYSKLANLATSFTGGNIIAKGLGQALNQGVASKQLDETQSSEEQQQKSLLEAIRKNKESGKDTSRLEAALSALNSNIEQTGTGAEDLLNPNKITPKQVVGDTLQLGTTIASAGTYGAAADGAKTGKLLSKAPSVVSKLSKGTGIIKGAIQGAKTGVTTGAIIGGASGFSQGLKEDKSILDSLKQGAVGAVGGGLSGGVVGGVIGGVSGGIQQHQLRKSILDAQEQVGLRPSLTETIKEKAKVDPKFNLIVKEAKKQGFGDSEINFLSTISKEDKPVLNKMYNLTVKAQSDPRQITRAGDVLGENVTNQVKQVIGLNKQAGKAVDLSAKALRGQEVNVSPLAERITSKLDDLGVNMAEDGTLDFSQSVFKNTPAVQKEIQKVIESVPDGSDAYQLHIFKKSIDEMVNYGTAGEGLKGAGANLLKSFRNSADEALDNAFDDYNKSNTAYKLTRDYIETAKGMVGKKVDLSSKEGSQAFGQALRSAFSNNKSRPNTLKFIEDTHLLSKQLGLAGSEKNLLDQALYVNMLEETFGSEAATGLAGEVSKAINTSMKIAEGIRNPVKGVLNVAGNVAEKMQKISPEAKKQILKAFLK